MKLYTTYISILALTISLYAQPGGGVARWRRPRWWSWSRGGGPGGGRGPGGGERGLVVASAAWWWSVYR